MPEKGSRQRESRSRDRENRSRQSESRSRERPLSPWIQRARSVDSLIDVLVDKSRRPAPRLIHNASSRRKKTEGLQTKSMQSRPQRIIEKTQWHSWESRSRESSGTQFLAVRTGIDECPKSAFESTIGTGIAVTRTLDQAADRRRTSSDEGIFAKPLIPLRSFRELRSRKLKSRCRPQSVGRESRSRETGSDLVCGSDNPPRNRYAEAEFVDSPIRIAAERTRRCGEAGNCGHANARFHAWRREDQAAQVVNSESRSREAR